jgi:Amt family ammonium transporter
MVYYQFVMAAIAVTILAGPLLGRIDFIAWMGFVFLWITFCYSIGAFSIWGGGFLFRMGVIDYSGGYVIHLSSGVAGFVASWFIGPGARIDNGVDASRPGNLLFAFTGASILWIGSNGFGRGYSYSATADAGVAIWNTNLCTAMSVLCWIVYDKLYFGKLSLLGAIEGMISGLVAIASGAGVVAGWSAVVIGLLCGTITWVSMNVIRRRITLLAQIDDHVGVLHTRCVAAFWGGVCTGIFATVEGCAAFGLENPGGGIDGNGRQVWLQ